MCVIILKQLATPAAIQKATYRLAPYADFDVIDNGDSFEITITPLKEKEVVDIQTELKRLVNDYSLREAIAEQTSVVRGLLYAQAFSKVTKTIAE